MHLRTTTKQFATIAQGDRVEKQKNDLLQYIKQEESHIVFVEDSLVDPTNDEKQLGKPISSVTFENILRTVLPLNIAFIDNPWIPDKKAIVRVKGTEFETICPYERGLMPEHSVMQLVTKEIPDSEVLGRRKAMNRKDLGKYEYVPGQGFVFDDTTVRPGFKRIKQVGRELKRGWRTVLLRLIQEGLISLYDVERLFGSKDHPSWAQNTGRREAVLPW